MTSLSQIRHGCCCLQCRTSSAHYLSLEASRTTYTHTLLPQSATLSGPNVLLDHARRSSEKKRPDLCTAFVPSLDVYMETCETVGPVGSLRAVFRRCSAEPSISADRPARSSHHHNAKSILASQSRAAFPQEQGTSARRRPTLLLRAAQPARAPTRPRPLPTPRPARFAFLLAPRVAGPVVVANLVVAALGAPVLTVFADAFGPRVSVRASLRGGGRRALDWGWAGGHAKERRSTG
jgi:hypothetical protein